MSEKKTMDKGLAQLLLEGIEMIRPEPGSEQEEVLKDSPEYQEFLSIESYLKDLIAKAECEGRPIKASDLEKVFSIVPKNAILPMSKVAQFTTQLLNVDAGIDDPHEIFVDRKKTVKVPVMVNREGVQLPENYTRYDDCVHNAVCSLLEAGNTRLTPEMIYRAMNGLSESEWVTPQAVASVANSIEKQRHIDVLIDCSEQAREWNKNLKKTTIRGHVIECRIVEGETHNGYKKQVYALLATPPIYEYSKMFNQVRTIPIDLLNVKGLRSTEKTTIVKNYLLLQIESMRGVNGRNKTILYESLFSDCDLKLTPVNVKRYRGYISTMLNQWIDQGYISGFTEKKKGRSFIGVTIKL